MKKRTKVVLNRKLSVKYVSILKTVKRNHNRCNLFLSKIAVIKPWKPEWGGRTYKAWYSKIDGSYITFCSTPTDISWLLHRGVTEQIQSCFESKSTANIGYNPKENKWYGWSHRAIFGFTIGSTVWPGDCGYYLANGLHLAKTMEDAKQMAINFAKAVS